MFKKKPKPKKGEQSGVNVVATNRKANHFFHIMEKFEAGIALQGCEVKSIRDHRVNLQDSFARVENGQIFLYNMHINPYKAMDRARFRIDPTRRRKLLLNKQEIKKLYGKTAMRGFTLIPLSVYFKGRYAKVSLGLAKGKNRWDKRETLRKRTADMEMRRIFKEKQR